MSVSILPYPFLDDKTKEKIRFQHEPFSFYFIDEKNLKHDLLLKTDDYGSFIDYITDISGKWNPDYYGLSLRLSISLMTFQCLFGNNGIAGKHAKIGLAVQWMSNDSKQRGVFRIVEFGCNDISPLRREVEFSFPKGLLRGKICFKIIMYLAQAGELESNEYHLINTPGHLLGELEKKEIIIDGTGSDFPIYNDENSSPSDPLWTLVYECDDPTENLFSDSVKILLNKAHRNYDFINKESKSFNGQLLAEIIASALTIIIDEVRKNKSDWQLIMDGSNLADGSVGQAIFYFKNTLKWEMDTSRNTSLSARRFFEKSELCK